MLDEADRLLDLGFADELNRVLALLPANRQTLLFSATFPAAVQTLANSLLRQPVRGRGGQHASDGAGHHATRDPGRCAPRTELLRHLLTENKWERVLVFVATQYATEHVAWKLHQKGIFATPFHGALSQGARRRVLQEFKDERWDVVVTTDLAARGLDIAELPVVVNYDLPRSPTDYVHRIGRTGRAGDSGLALSFVSAATEAHFRLIEKRQGLSLPREQVAASSRPTPMPRQTWRRCRAPAASRASGPARKTSCAPQRPKNDADRPDVRRGSVRTGSAAFCDATCRLGPALGRAGPESRCNTGCPALGRACPSSRSTLTGVPPRPRLARRQLAIKVPIVHALGQGTAAFAGDVLAHLVLDGFQHPVGVLALRAQLKCFSHARW